jgi:hypothetical protein
LPVRGSIPSTLCEHTCFWQCCRQMSLLSLACEHPGEQASPDGPIVTPGTAAFIPPRQIRAAKLAIGCRACYAKIRGSAVGRALTCTFHSERLGRITPAVCRRLSLFAIQSRGNTSTASNGINRYAEWHSVFPAGQQSMSSPYLANN